MRHAIQMGTFLQRYTACPRYFALFHFFVCSLGAQQQFYQCMAFYQTVKAKHRPRCKRLTHNSCVIVHIWPESKPGRQKSNTRVRLCTIILQHKDRKFRISHWFIIYDFDCILYCSAAFFVNDKDGWLCISAGDGSCRPIHVSELYMQRISGTP